ncbi:hypothetical protein KIN20_000427 [Parelaphostrongylus tenuis]|uniref:Uncharacterized protein n=1 Tax=Parelaphostrongylus tenuis TaxID=148309 RepID=A0AAD5MKM6_PARTN|nr:hypothetical protein KIN20_000427 [Parelaphostrongylus tenuis]
MEKKESHDFKMYNETKLVISFGLISYLITSVTTSPVQTYKTPWFFRPFVECSPNLKLINHRLPRSVFTSARAFIDTFSTNPSIKEMKVKLSSNLLTIWPAHLCFAIDAYSLAREDVILYEDLTCSSLLRVVSAN